nr:MAG TPA: 4Fe-4S binding domain protein [Caudoviricetes sp.]
MPLFVLLERAVERYFCGKVCGDYATQHNSQK